MPTKLNLYVTCKDKCWNIEHEPGSAPTANNVDDVQSDHEESDTRLILHGIHAASLHDDVIIQSPDTDVAVLCIAFADQFHHIYFKSITRQLFSITKLRSALPAPLPLVIIGLHAFTGCDTTSSFSGKNKCTLYMCYIK